MATDRRCECGAGSWVEGIILHVVPHSMDCAWLREFTEREKTHCVRCDIPKVVENGGELVYCPNGCSRRMSGLDEFDATSSGWIRDELDTTLDAEFIG